MADITEADVQAAQQIWGEGIVDIGRLSTEGGDFVSRAADQVDNLYAYSVASVVFKPTKAAAIQFRNNREAALSYFVGGNDQFSEDKGFALQPWTKVRFENCGIICHGETAIAMGNYFFTDTSGNETKVEYSFGYIRDKENKLRIILHHSSLPYSG